MYVEGIHGIKLLLVFLFQFFKIMGTRVLSQECRRIKRKLFFPIPVFREDSYFADNSENYTSELTQLYDSDFSTPRQFLKIAISLLYIKWLTKMF